MPLTTLHYHIAYFLHKLDKRLSLHGLVLGSMPPDLEIPIMLLLFRDQSPHRLILHSLLGSATIGTFLALIITIRIYPSLSSALFGVEKKKVEQKCKLSLASAFSVCAGIISCLAKCKKPPFQPNILAFPLSQSHTKPILFRSRRTT